MHHFVSNIEKRNREYLEFSIAIIQEKALVSLGESKKEQRIGRFFSKQEIVKVDNCFTFSKKKKNALKFVSCA